MKKIILVLVILLSMAIIAGCDIDIPGTETTPEITPTSTPEEVNTKEYVNEQYSFKTRYPKDWTVNTTFQGVIVTFMCPDSSSGFTPNLNIVINGNLPGINTLDDLTAAAKSELSAAIENFQEIEMGDFSINGYDGKYIFYKGTVSGMDLVWAQVYSLNDGVAYIITYTADEANFEKYLEDAEIIAENIEIIK